MRKQRRKSAASKVTMQLISAFVFLRNSSTIPLLTKYEATSLLKQTSLRLQPGLCWTWSDTPKTSFLVTRLKLQSRFSCDTNLFNSYGSYSMSYINSLKKGLIKAYTMFYYTCIMEKYRFVGNGIKHRNSKLWNALSVRPPVILTDIKAKTVP